MSDAFTELAAIPAGTDYFTVLGMPRRLSLDPRELEQAYYGLSRQYHPDRFATAEPKARIASLEATALINRAYRTLREPWERARYLVQLEGLSEAQAEPPMALFEEILDLQESLGDLRLAIMDGEASEALGAHVLKVARPFRCAYAETETRLQALTDAWDATDEGEAARQREIAGRLASLLGERRYLQRVNEDVDAALQGKPAARGT